MSDRPTNLILRSDTILGVCQGLGEEFGFHPNWLRIAFAAAFYWGPVAVSGTYLALGLALVLARWIYPVSAAPAAPALAAPAAVANQSDDLQLAA